MNVTLIGGDALVTNEFWQISGAAGEGTLMPSPPTRAAGRRRPRSCSASAPATSIPRAYVLYTYARDPDLRRCREEGERGRSAPPRRRAEGQGPWQTVLGPISFDQKGDVTVRTSLLHLRNGAYAEMS